MPSVLLTCLICLLLLGCSGSKESAKRSAPGAKSETAPEISRVTLDTSKGEVVVELIREWAPRGADRFYNLVKSGFYDGNRFFRMLPNFVVQWGINGDPSMERLWANMMFPDDPVKQSNRRGTIAFATRGPGTRTTQVFINLRDNTPLDARGFAPFGRVVSGMEVVERFYSGYGEGAPRGTGPSQDLIETQGNSYLEAKFPRLDFIRKATVQP